MTPSPACLELVKRFEGLRLDTYLDPVVGIPTIGYGHTRGVKPGDVCTQEQAEAWLLEDLTDTAAALAPYPSLQLSQPQFDALCSIIYNVGPGKVGVRDGIIWLSKYDLGGVPRHSTLLKCCMNRQWRQAADEFLRWNHAGGKVWPGLTARRQAERELFLSGTVSET